MKKAIHILLDSSEYMHDLREQVLETMDQYLHPPGGKEESFFGWSSFNGELHHHYMAKPVHEVIWNPVLEYKPAGPSILYDAMMNTMQLLREHNLPKNHAVELVIITRGFDTGSVHSLDEVKQVIRDVKDMRIRFSGANIQAMEHAALTRQQFAELYGR
jgi:hypothetical protein